MYDVERVSGAFRRARYALLRTLTGMLALALGVLLGSQLALDGAAGGAPLLLMVAAAVIALGSGLDLALDVLGPALRGQVHLQIDLRDAGSVKLSGVSLGEADAFLERLQAVLSARG